MESRVLKRPYQADIVYPTRVADPIYDLGPIPLLNNEYQPLQHQEFWGGLIRLTPFIQLKLHAMCVIHDPHLSRIARVPTSTTSRVLGWPSQAHTVYPTRIPHPVCNPGPTRLLDNTGTRLYNIKCVKVTLSSSHRLSNSGYTPCVRSRTHTYPG
ncbi:hypothetical protein NC652_024593 [Populus alba x Populus x berolinensis]|nr:hypothetical protein NC652_024593 [Populus alba x Populus x berolinensis]